MNIGVIGYSGNIFKEPVKSLTSLCDDVGRIIAENNWVLVNGGRDGIMQLVSKAVKNRGGYVIGFLPWQVEGNDYLDFSIKTGLDLNMRSFVLLKNVDVVVSIGGEIGTAIEILGAYFYKKPILLMKNSGGWTDRITEVLIEGKFLDNRKLVELKQVPSIDELERVLKSIEEVKNK
ncbi:TIGR00725 family protein [Petrotoga sibirica]|uniref:TIGR00725 family protein n=1 Tax=Petrotoga sibirica DSM 13575 TaxID=1122956 RepID=A0A855MQR6_9BACT|nr:TIGR00725 family protein [Petrotoga sibirica]POZ88595.1 hypothetical protein AA80_05565 [Petrotoga sibirica DSM 13575]